MDNIIKPDYLSHKYFMFCEVYIKTNNASEAARQAGYSVKTAGITGHNLLKHPKIKRYLEERTRPYREQQEAEERQAVADSNEILEYFTTVMRGEVPEGERKPSYVARNQAAIELAKRVVDTETADNPVQIVVDIPRPVRNKEKKNAEDSNNV